MSDNLSLADAKEASAEAQSGNLRDNDAGIPDSLRPDNITELDAPITRLHPECLVVFDAIVDFQMFNTGEDFLDARQNLENGGPRGYGNDVILTVENPSIVEGELWAEDHDFRDLRVVGDVDSDFSPYSRNEEVTREDGEVVGAETVGVDLGISEFEGQPTEAEDFEHDYVQLLISSRRATEVLGQLDTAGKWAHDTETGEFTGGIVEAPPNLGTDAYDPEEDGAPRAIGYPELRADMVGTKGAISMFFDPSDYEDQPTSQTSVELTLYDAEDGLEALTPLTPEDDAYAQPTYPRRNNRYWDHDGTDGVDADAEATAEPSTDDGMAQAKAMLDDEPDDLVDYDSLDADAQEFVDTAVTAMEARDYDSVAEFGDFEERVASEDGVDIDAEALATIIDDRVGE